MIGAFSRRRNLLGGGAGLYDFSEFTFTTANLIGRFGPTTAQLLTSYDTTTYDWLNEPEFFTTSSGIQLWTVPSDGVYQIVCKGASGGRATGGPNGGAVNISGAIISGNVWLESGAIIKILVGHEGLTSNSWAGGGGGSFVTELDNSPIIVAGGGGGNGWLRSGGFGSNQRGRSSTFSGYSNVGEIIMGNIAYDGNAPVGCYRYGFSGGDGTSGSGFINDGTIPSGATSSAASFLNGGVGCDGNASSFGGFGGGGAGSGVASSIQGGGGGGGYSGGANGHRRWQSGNAIGSCPSSTNVGTSGGGGGSFISEMVLSPLTSDGVWEISGTEPHPVFDGDVGDMGGWNAGHGQVIITKL